MKSVRSCSGRVNTHFICRLLHERDEEVLGLHTMWVWCSGGRDAARKQIKHMQVWMMLLRSGHEHVLCVDIQRSCESAFSLFLGQSPFCRLIAKTGNVVVSSANDPRRCVFALIMYAYAAVVAGAGMLGESG